MPKTKSKMKGKSELIECPNFPWKIFLRGGVYYADGRSHGRGKHSLNTRDRSEAIEALFMLDRLVANNEKLDELLVAPKTPSSPCLLYTSPSPRDRQKSRMPSSA